MPRLANAPGMSRTDCVNSGGVRWRICGFDHDGGALLAPGLGSQSVHRRP